MANEQERSYRNSDPPEQKSKEQDPNKDIDPQREQSEAQKNKSSEKNPDDFNG
ncbi:hypothetical protein [Thalassobacillus pellis]|uniref:hypothetical protein n=1 Tax=Thalassobacillus pellis TaxID=748008 RepID=UPI0019612C7A|nr:hypothetical protein [Thalassobacillus pellis]MBM7552004.1 hypothetical protein [Thalassobacillus pellis]